MPRVKRAIHARKKRAKVLEQAKGYYGRKKSSYRFAKEQVEHSLVYAYRDRKARKRPDRIAPEREAPARPEASLCSQASRRGGPLRRRE